MRIPRSFTIGGIKWKVVQKDNLEGDCLGLTHRDIATVEIKKGLKQDLKEQTFFHELFHVIFFTMGLPVEKHDETLIEAVAHLLHQITITSK